MPKVGMGEGGFGMLRIAFKSLINLCYLLLYAMQFVFKMSCKYTAIFLIIIIITLFFYVFVSFSYSKFTIYSTLLFNLPLISFYSSSFLQSIYNGILSFISSFFYSSSYFFSLFYACFLLFIICSCFIFNLFVITALNSYFL